MWPGAACRLIRPPIFIFPPAAATAAQCTFLHWTHLWPFNAGAARAAPVPHWSFQGRAPLHAAANGQAAMSSSAEPPGLCPAEPSRLGAPCNNKRGPASSPGELCEAKLKRRFPPDQPPADAMQPRGGAAWDGAATNQGPVGSTNCGPAEQCAEQQYAEQYDPVLAATNVRKQVRKSRFWVPTELGQIHNSGGGGGRGRAGDLVFTVLSYNVLAQCLLEDNPYLYQHCHEEVLHWPLRRGNLLAELREADADILCLQELQEDHYETDFKPELEKMGYGCLYKRRTGNKHDGCGIFFRKSVFELDRSQAVEYSRSGVTVLDRDNVALIALLRPVGGDFASDFRLCVSTTHLLFNPRRGDIKLAQLCLLLAEVDRLAARGQAADGSPLYWPIVLCGDMNSEPHSPLYAFLARGTLCYEGMLSGDVSGQSDGANRGRAIPLDDCLHQLHISGSSRYLPAEEEDQKPAEEDGTAQDVSSSNDDPVTAGTPTKKLSTESPAADTSSTENTQAKESRKSSPTRDPGDAASPAKKATTEEAKHGVVSHNLNLVSAYRHDVTGVHAEVTTHHQRASCTVDYIFYSVKGKETVVRNGRVVHSRVVEGPLRLLATYRLMSPKQLMAVGGLPNEVQSSDHLPLVAKYLLRQPS